MRFLVAALVCCVVASTTTTGALTLEKSPSQGQIIENLLQRTALVSKMLLGPAVNCSCSDYCQGNCFAFGCALCDPSAFSFPGGESLCLAPGPLGCGLLCRVDHATRLVTEHACCNVNGPQCYLPANSCCSDGGCSTCPAPPPPRPDELPSDEIYPMLNSSRTRCRRRKFVNDTCLYA
jgi:hypothetical protein